ncbi:hypothetical protein SERLA73DRAFT_151223 [Serpula lacrymans var. lacrymans S7.3]|uniref:Uncharacterized protein n=1 Tax=Serpula lacrymans var. lacrymans (strain S7.3) TaxID=936435 RepID=F8PQX9_SERL3|nr:hypothetical protein SERLA73DRAFT_151223 [Serpula lacrymans var. lacrymans S7.3]
MSSNKSYHPSNSSSELDRSVGRISEDEDEIDDEDKDKDGDEENKDEDEDEDKEDNGEDEKEDDILFPSPSLGSSAQSDLPPKLMNWPHLSESPAHSVEPSPSMAPSPSPSQLGQEILPSPTPSEVVHLCTLSLSGRGHQRWYYTHSSSSSPQSLNVVLTDRQTVSVEQDQRRTHPELLTKLVSTRTQLNLIEQDRAQLLATCQKLEEDLGWVQAERDAANAHCTIISHVVEETRKQLGVVTKKKQGGTGKIKARFVTHPALKAHFDQEEAKRSKKAKERAAKDAQKAVHR